jgi:hypothetical protein
MRPKVRQRVSFKLFDVVELVDPLPGRGLPLGSVGTIVHELPENFYMVEFMNEEGTTIALEEISGTSLAGRP